VKKIALLENEFSIEGGELTPTLKVKRRVIGEKYRELIDRMYAEAEGAKAPINFSLSSRLASVPPALAGGLLSSNLANRPTR